jgi:hypothetical protein
MDALREEAALENLQNAIIFLYTHDHTVEAALVKGNLSSEKLFELLTLEVHQILICEKAPDESWSRMCQASA